MNVLVFSDTHGHSSCMLDVVAREKDVTAIFFLGDGVRDTFALEEAYPKIPLYRVCGNCDFSSLEPELGLAPIGNHLVFYTHGHLYDVKYSTDALVQAAKSRGASIALYGHTHKAHLQQKEGIHLLNPGSLTQPRGNGPTYGRISIANGSPSFEIVAY